MNSTSHFGHESCRAELIWNRARSGTVTSLGGHELRVGPEHEWTAERLFSIALQSALMGAFLRLAEESGLRVLGYLSSGYLKEASEVEGPRFMLQPCVVVATEDDRRLAEHLLVRAAASHPCELLGETLVVTPHVVATLAPASQ